MLVAGCLMLDGGFGGVIGVNWGGKKRRKKLDILLTSFGQLDKLISTLRRRHNARFKQDFWDLRASGAYYNQGNRSA